MKGKIAFEEHMSLRETLDDARVFAGESGKWDEFARQILDIGDERLTIMDKSGIEFAILSLNAPAIQAILDTKKAIERLRGPDESRAASRKFPESKTS